MNSCARCTVTADKIADLEQIQGIRRICVLALPGRHETYDLS